MQSQFGNRTVQKTYLVRVHGVPAKEQFSVDDKIDLSTGESGRRVVSEDGAEAHTDFEVVRQFDDGTTLLKAYPRSGRTNQIRLHLQASGLPIVGDNAYGKEPDVLAGMVSHAETLHLHAHGIAFCHPAGDHGRVEFLTRPPDWAKSA